MCAKHVAVRLRRRCTARMRQSAARMSLEISAGPCCTCARCVCLNMSHFVLDGICYIWQLRMLFSVMQRSRGAHFLSAVAGVSQDLLRAVEMTRNMPGMQGTIR